MSAAVALSSRGVPVTVYESAQRLGGRARKVEHKYGTLDNGQHLLVGAYRSTLRLIETVGLPAERLWRMPLTWRVLPRFSFRAGPLPAPWHLASGLLRCSGLPAAARIGCIRFLAHCRRTRYALDEDMTVSALMHARNQHSQAMRLLWEPLCIAALNTRPEQASARVFLNVLRDTLGSDRHASDMILPRTDLSALFPEPASAYVRARGGQVLLAEPVLRIDPSARGLTLTMRSGRRAHAAVVLASQPSRVPRLVAHLPELVPVIKAITAMTHEPIVTVYLRYLRSPRMPAPMLGFADACTQWLFDRGAISGEPGLIAAVISARGRHQNLSHTDLARCVHREIAAAFAPVDPPHWTQVIEEKRATIACTPDLARPDQRTPLAGLFLAGDYTSSDYPATLESAVQSGLRCADLVCKHLGAA